MMSKLFSISVFLAVVSTEAADFYCVGLKRSFLRCMPKQPKQGDENFGALLPSNHGDLLGRRYRTKKELKDMNKGVERTFYNLLKLNEPGIGATPFNFLKAKQLAREAYKQAKKEIRAGEIDENAKLEEYYPIAQEEQHARPAEEQRAPSLKRTASSFSGSLRSIAGSFRRTRATQQPEVTNAATMSFPSAFPGVTSLTLEFLGNTRQFNVIKEGIEFRIPDNEGEPVLKFAGGSAGGVLGWTLNAGKGKKFSSKYLLKMAKEYDIEFQEKAGKASAFDPTKAKLLRLKFPAGAQVNGIGNGTQVMINFQGCKGVDKENIVVEVEDEFVSKTADVAKATETRGPSHRIDDSPTTSTELPLNIPVERHDIAVVASDDSNVDRVSPRKPYFAKIQGLRKVIGIMSIARTNGILA